MRHGALYSTEYIDLIRKKFYTYVENNLIPGLIRICRVEIRTASWISYTKSMRTFYDVNKTHILLLELLRILSHLWHEPSCDCHDRSVPEISLRGGCIYDCFLRKISIVGIVTASRPIAIEYIFNCPIYYII